MCIRDTKAYVCISKTRMVREEREKSDCGRVKWHFAKKRVLRFSRYYEATTYRTSAFFRFASASGLCGMSGSAADV